MLPDDEVRGVGPRIVRTLAAMPGFRCDAEDACQAAWLEFLTHHDALRDRRRLAAWLTTVARRHAIRAIAYRARAARLPAEEPAPSPESILATDERAAVLWRVVSQLPERPRRLLLLIAHHPELKAWELAAELGISPASVSKLRRRSLDHVRRKLEAEGFDHA